MRSGLLAGAVAAGLALSTAGAAGQTAADTQAKPPAVDLPVLHVQVVLDRLGFAPGVLDGKRGQSLTAALKGFQEASGLPVTGRIDSATLARLKRFAAWTPTKTLMLNRVVLDDSYVQPWPEKSEAQAKLPRLGYRNALEKLSEMFHTTPETLIALNSPQTRLAAGQKLRVPNALPTSRDYRTDDATWRKTLNELNVGARQPQAARIVVNKSDGVLKVYADGDKLVAQFPATMGSEHDPLPIGRWTIKGVATNPPFHYNPELFWDVSDDKRKLLLPPGPNGPVGVVWIDLSKPHYGIHGTSAPHQIGRAESHGCIRLTNWDAARLALMVKPGTPAIFRE